MPSPPAPVTPEPDASAASAPVSPTPLVLLFIPVWGVFALALGIHPCVGVMVRAVCVRVLHVTLLRIQNDDYHTARNGCYDTPRVL